MMRVIDLLILIEFTMPKTPSKGEIPARVLRLPKPALISAVRNQKKPDKEERSKPIISVDEARSMLKVVVPHMPALVSYYSQYQMTVLNRDMYLHSHHHRGLWILNPLSCY